MGLLVSDFDLPIADTVKLGANAPDFILPSNLGNEWSLSAHRGQVITLLFYPQDETLVCTKQLCSIRDNWADYLATKAVVIGISPGKIEEHQAFAKKHRLPMPLLVDEGRAVTKIFGKHDWLPISWTRAIVVIDANGIIRQRKVMFRGFRPTDYSVLTAIYQAKTDASQEKCAEILRKFQEKQKRWI